MRINSLHHFIARGLAACALTLPFVAHAAQGNDAADFHELLRSAVSEPLKAESTLSMIHMLPDQAALDASDASSVAAAIVKMQGTSLEKLGRATLATAPSHSLDADAVLSTRPITLVIVPGIFGEFIPVRAFEDVLSLPSNDRDLFQKQVSDLAASNDPNAKDSSLNFTSLQQEECPLTDLIKVGSMTDKSGRTLARVVLLYTPFMSLESLGSDQDRAAKFNRRLQKYLAITGPQTLALVGYSRGTGLALEMLSQAQSQNLSYLPNVKAMISLAGVNWGSTLADDMKNPNSPAFAAVQQIRQLRSALDPNSVASTLGAWIRFGVNMVPILPKLTSHKIAPKTSDLKASPIHAGLDAVTLVNLLRTFGRTLGLDNPVGDFGSNVIRFQTLADAVLTGAEELTTTKRVQWWQTHTVPRDITYYTISAAMPNPDLSAYDRSVYAAKLGYNGSYDDLSLLQNRLDYEALSGIALNDSQVSVAQTMILPNAIAALNPANAGLKTEFLGVVGTHHWGMALRVVNAMQDGRLNPFPRAALAKALAAKVALDSTN